MFNPLKLGLREMVGRDALHKYIIKRYTRPPMTNIKAGSDIDAPCGRCKLELAHVVVAAVDGTAAQVECKTCGSIHKYRAIKKVAHRVGKQPITRERKSPSTSGKKRIENRELTADQIAGNVPYSPTRTFIHGQIIAHAMFGYGCVEHVADSKIEVSFREQRRILIHNRPAA